MLNNETLSQRMELSANALREAKQYLNAVVDEVSDENDKQEIQENIASIKLSLESCEEIIKRMLK